MLTTDNSRMEIAGDYSSQQNLTPAVSADQDIRHLIPKPATIKDTGLSQWLLADLACKHLAESGVLDLRQISERMALPGIVIEELFHFLRAEGRIELSGRRDDSPLLRFNLTDRGRILAAEAQQRDGYVGPAPITLELYEKLISAQSATHHTMTRERTEALFADTVIAPELLGRLGPAVHSGRAIFIYGQPGTGKSFIARRLKRALGPALYLPHALVAGDSIIRYLDPSIHKPVYLETEAKKKPISQGIDSRLLLCERPMVIAAGELTMDLLDLQFDSAKRLYVSPLQLKANGGLLIIDDLGRQRIPPDTLLNRWIMPMEEQRDQLSLSTGQHISVPFDLTLIFSTNLEPTELADEAFLRRIGYKVRLKESTPAEYRSIWKQCCDQLGIEFDQELLTFVMQEFYPEENMPLLPCHPRDLLQLSKDIIAYLGKSAIDEDAMRWAWKNYFLEI